MALIEKFEWTLRASWGDHASAGRAKPKPRQMFLMAKRAFDIVFSIFLLVPLGLISVALLLLNPWLNPGPLFFVQLRMGKDCKAFKPKFNS